VRNEKSRKTEEKGQDLQEKVVADSRTVAKKRVRLFVWLNKPLPVTLVGGILVLLISTFVQERYWKSQQVFLADQTLAKQRLDAAVSTQEEMAKVVGRLIAANALLVGAHESQLAKKQYNEVIDQHNLLQREWDLSEETLQLHMTVYFQTPEIQKAWLDVRELLGQLDDELSDLEEFTPDKPSEKQTEQIKQCRTTIDETEKGLAMLAQLMSAYIETLARRH
jgi:hypothetical protein